MPYLLMEADICKSISGFAVHVCLEHFCKTEKNCNGFFHKSLKCKMKMKVLFNCN